MVFDGILDKQTIHRNAQEKRVGDTFVFTMVGDAIDIRNVGTG